MMKVAEITELILMPISWLVSKSLATARMAMPTLVRSISWVSSSTRAITRKGVRMTAQRVGVPAMVTVSDKNGMVG